jgi:hypothetical protein
MLIKLKLREATLLLPKGLMPFGVVYQHARKFHHQPHCSFQAHFSRASICATPACNDIGRSDRAERLSGHTVEKLIQVH